MSRPPSGLSRTSGRSWVSTKNSSGSIRANREARRSLTRWRRAPVAARPASIHPPNAMTIVARLAGGSRSNSTWSMFIPSGGDVGVGPRAGGAARGTSPAARAGSRMRSPGGRRQQLDLLGHEQRTELHRESLDEVLVGKDRRPVRPAVGVVVELPEMDELIDGARV